MAVLLDLLKEGTTFKGEIGELIVSSYLRRLGFIVKRPYQVLRVLDRAGAAGSYEAQFLWSNQKTMDFFAVSPSDDPLLLEREALCRVFKVAGLKRYMDDACTSAFVVEVKTALNGVLPQPSKKQKRMFQVARKLGFEVMIAQVSLKENYSAEIVFKDETGKELELND